MATTFWLPSTESRTPTRDHLDTALSFHQALTALAGKLGVTAANYRNTDTNNRAAISSLDLP
jgi:hypothetical protein